MGQGITGTVLVFPFFKPIGNIGLLKLCGELDLIDPLAALEVANAYRLFRKLQHNIRLQGEDNARVPHEKIASELLATCALWESLFH